MSDKHLRQELNLPWQDTETAAGKGKVVDNSGFAVCNTSGGSYEEQRQRAKFIRISANNHEALVRLLKAYVNACLEQDIMLGAITGEAKQLLEQVDER